VIKITGKILVSIIMVLLLTTLASAAVQISSDSVKLNVDYSTFDNEDDSTIRAATETFTISNTDATAAQVTITATFTKNNYNLVSTKTATIEPGASASFSLDVDVPHNLDSGEQDIGTITVSVGGSARDTAVLRQVTESMLVIDELTVDYRGEKDSAQDDSFDQEEDDVSLAKDVLVGTEMVFTFSMRNLFDNDYDTRDGKIDNIELMFDVDDSDIYLESVEDTYDLDDMKADEDQDLKITFFIDPEADAGDYTFTITLEGEDGKGAKHKVEKEVKLDVIRDDNDVRIITADVSPQTITLCEKKFTLNLEIENIGNDDQEYAGVAVYSKELGIDENAEEIELNSYDDSPYSWDKVFTFNPQKLSTGKYFIDVVTFYDRDEQSDLVRVPITVTACPKATAPVSSNDAEDNVADEENVVALDDEEDTDDAPVVETKTTTKTATAAPTTGNRPTVPSTVTTSDIVRSIERGYSQEDFIVGGIVIVAILLFAMIALFVAILIKK